MAKLLREDVEMIIAEKGISKQSAIAYRHSVKLFSEFLGKPATRKQLKVKHANGFVAIKGPGAARSITTALKEDQGDG